MLRHGRGGLSDRVDVSNAARAGRRHRARARRRIDLPVQRLPGEDVAHVICRQCLVFEQRVRQRIQITAILRKDRAGPALRGFNDAADLAVHDLRGRRRDRRGSARLQAQVSIEESSLDGLRYKGPLTNAKTLSSRVNSRNCRSDNGGTNSQSRSPTNTSRCAGERRLSEVTLPKSIENCLDRAARDAR